MARNVTIGVIDLGISNLGSVISAMNEVTSRIQVINASNSQASTTQDLLLLPGVGNFGAAANKLHYTGLEDKIKNHILKDKPVLAICLGLQLLFETSEESLGSAGLGVVKGSVKRLTAENRTPVPNVGWSEVDFVGAPFREEFGNRYDFYFTHSFYVDPKDSHVIVGESTHGSKRFVSGVLQRKIIGFQFHPEKSGKSGELLIKSAFNYLTKD